MKRGPTELNHERNVKTRTDASSQPNPELTLLTLTNEMLVTMATFLDPEDLDKCRLVCAQFDELFTFHSDQLWRPFLNRLHLIDASILNTTKQGKTLRATFIEGLAQVRKKQEIELHFVKNVFPDEAAAFDLEGSLKFNSLLDQLEYQSKQLELLNCMLIQTKIDASQNKQLVFSDMPITRFPSQILEGKNRDFFEHLEVLFLNDSYLEFLPNNLDICQNLQELTCTNSELRKLPECIGNITSLRKLSLANNRLTSLPKEIGNLFNLQYIGCAHNDIAALPVEIMMIWDNLTTKEFSNNLIGYLPKAISGNWQVRTYIKFIKSQRVPITIAESDIELHDNEKLWIPLLLELKDMHVYQNSNSEQKTLRDQFVTLFRQIAKLQVKEMVLAISHHEHASEMLNFSNEDFTFNKETGEYELNEATLDKMIENHQNLEEFNLELIDAAHKREDQNSSTRLDISQLKLTRIPLEISEPAIMGLPTRAELFQALQELPCAENQIVYFSAFFDQKPGIFFMQQHISTSNPKDQLENAMDIDEPNPAPQRR